MANAVADLEKTGRPPHRMGQGLSCRRSFTIFFPSSFRRETRLTFPDYGHDRGRLRLDEAFLINLFVQVEREYRGKCWLMRPEIGQGSSWFISAISETHMLGQPGSMKSLKCFMPYAAMEIWPRNRPDAGQVRDLKKTRLVEVQRTAACNISYH